MYKFDLIKTCVIYIRVSSERQVKGYSLDGQKRYLTECAERRGIKVLAIYVEEGRSGKSIDGRTAFQSMLSDISTGAVKPDYVLVYKLSRFGRNARDILNSLEYIMKYNVHLMCVEDGLDSSTAMGKMMITILGAVAELERENIIAQSLLGREEKAKTGGWNGGFAPYGYKLDKGKLIVDENKREAVSIIFKMFLEGKSYASIVKYLNRNGYKREKAPNNPNHKFTSWDTRQIKMILDSPIYTGRMSWGRRRTEKVEGTENEYKLVKQDDYIVSEFITHEAYITDEEFEKIQELRALTKKRGNQNIGQQNAHLLSGIARCPQCGSAMYISYNTWKNKDGTNRKTYTYICGHYMKALGSSDCNRNGVSSEKLEREVIQYTKRLLKNPRFAHDIGEKIGSAMSSEEIQKELDYYKKQLRILERNKKNLENDIDHIEDTDKFADRKRRDYNKRLDKLMDEIYEMEDIIQEWLRKYATIKKNEISIDTIYDLLVSFDKVYDKMDDREKRELIKSMIKEIRLLMPEEQKKQKHIVDKIVYRFPMLVDQSGDFLRNKNHHVETVCLLSKLNVKHHIEVELHMDELDLTAAESKATYEEIKNYVLEHTGLKVSNLYIAQIKQKCGIIERVNYNLPKSENSRQPKCPPEKEAAIREALEHFRMI